MKMEIKVGIFVTIALLILFFATIFLTNLKWLGKGYEIYVVFDSLNDMRVKSKVKFAGGVIVGSVSNVVYNEKDSNLVVTARIDNNVRIRENSNFSISTRGLMGEKYLNITGGTSDKPFIKSGTVLQGMSPLSMDAGLGKLFTISDDFRAALSSFNSIIGSPEMRVAVAKTSQNISEAVANINKIILENKDKINTTFSTLEDSAKALKEIGNNLAGLSKDLKEFVNVKNKETFQDTLQNLNEISIKLDKTIDSMNSLTNKADRGDGVLGVLINDKKMAEDLKALIKDIKENPWKLIWKEQKK